MHGYSKGPGETLLEFSHRISAAGHPDLGDKALAFVKLYYLKEYGENRKGDRLEILIKDIQNELERPTLENPAQNR